jgi:hypothetical protein
MIRAVAQPSVFAEDPVLGLLSTADAALDAVLGALASRFPKLDQSGLSLDPWHRHLRQAQILAGMTRALQALIGDYYGTLLDELEPDSDNDPDF